MDIIDRMVESNDPGYNFDKAIEELFELGEVLMKRKLKEGHPKSPKDQEIIDELGDVTIRLNVLIRIFGEEEVEKRVAEKLLKFEGYFNDNKYIGRI